MARWHKLQGKKVFFSAGTDEHGAKIETAAIGDGKNPQEFVDEKAKAFQLAWKKLNISYKNNIFVGGWKGIFSDNEKYKMDEKIVGKAEQCGYRSILILLGVLKNMNYTFKNHCYESPFGVGYLTGQFLF